MEANEVRLLTIPQAAKKLSLSTRSIHRMISTKGAIPGVVRLAGRSVRLNAAVLDQWIEAGCPRDFTPLTTTTATGPNHGRR